MGSIDVGRHHRLLAAMINTARGTLGRRAAALTVLFGAASLHAQPVDATWLRVHYRTIEARIPMRDGVRLFTSIDVPRDIAGHSFPILLTRTPFGAGPYGDSTYRRALGPSGNQWRPAPSC